ncbi:MULTISPECIES: IS110 family transposase, partial [unclassified Lentimonas]|uniref:IS110 family transposase n=1 Tax=unclassified Lentimonas TaxID=2630993 RepID=UPI00132C8992
MKKPTSIKPDRDSVLIGLDWAKEKHDYCLQTPEGDYEFGQIEQDDIKLHDWLDYLSERFEGRRLTICMEAGRDPLLWRLETHEQVDLFVVNTTTAARYRKTFTPSGDKNDQRDAASVLDLMQRHPGKIRPHLKASAQDRALDQLNQARRNTVNRRTGVISSLREVLELFYPVASKLFDDLSLPMALEFLKRWPDPLSLSKTRNATFEKFFHQHHSRSKKLLEKRLDLIAHAHCLTEEPILLEVARMRIADHMNQINTLNESIKDYERSIAAVFVDHEKAELFDSLPGAAQKLAPRLLAAFCLINPKNASQMQSMIGIAPIRVQSGKSERTFMRRQCPKFHRQSFHEFAGCSINSSLWAKAYYDQHIKLRGGGTQAAKRALAFKWIRIIMACWRTNTPYNEMKYIESLQKRNSPLKELIF